MKNILDISYQNDGLSKRLSNLYPYEFEIDGYKMKSWEGFIQSLKTPDIELKKQLWGMYGYKAWKSGQKINWWDKQELYWITKPIKRESNEYTELITRSYDCLYKQNKEYRKALKESLPYKLDHKIGKVGKSNTLLTKSEYLFQLDRLRNKIKSRNFYNLMNLFK